ncbi:MAG: hypothetical protein OEY33_03670 [Bdellovibrionales bacterium]|jgi:hypothetical protein|nr:hypothetical protein [Bdellovibrionales bacterium]
MKGKILNGDKLVAEIKNFDHYITQDRITFKTSETIPTSSVYTLTLDNGDLHSIQITSSPTEGNPGILIHAAIIKPT